MYTYKIVEQVSRKTKKMTGVLRKMMVVLAVIFILLGICVLRAFMLPGFLMVLLYFAYDILSVRDYEYTLDGNKFTIDVILGKRYRRTAHELDLGELEVTAPNTHESVARYRAGSGSEKLPKFDYTSYDDEVPYYTMIIMEKRKKIKILLDLNENMLRTLKTMYPDRVYIA